MTDSVTARLDAARCRYLARLPGYGHHLRLCLAACEYASIAQAAHRLAGSAGLHGLADVAGAARALEAACRAGAPWSQLEAHLSTLCRMLEAHADTP